MAIQVTTWSPDTCSCTFQYSWDDSTSGEGRHHTFFSAPVICEFHISLAAQHMALARDEPQRHIDTVDSRLAVYEEIIARNEQRIMAEAEEEATRKSQYFMSVVGGNPKAHIHPKVAQILQSSANPQAHVDRIRAIMANRRLEILGEFALTFSTEHALADAAYNACVGETQRKNGVIDQATTQFSTQLTDSQPDNSSRVLKDSVKLSYSGTAPNRVITIAVGNLLNSSEKGQLQNACDTRFGAGTVVIS